MAWREQEWIRHKEGRRGKVADRVQGQINGGEQIMCAFDEQITVLYRDDSFCLMIH